jgi:hypothetical protein
VVVELINIVLCTSRCPVDRFFNRRLKQSPEVSVGINKARSNIDKQNFIIVIAGWIPAAVVLVADGELVPTYSELGVDTGML